MHLEGSSTFAAAYKILYKCIRGGKTQKCSRKKVNAIAQPVGITNAKETMKTVNAVASTFYTEIKLLPLLYDCVTFSCSPSKSLDKFEEKRHSRLPWANGRRDTNWSA